MAKRIRIPSWSKSLQRTFGTMTRRTLHASAKTWQQSLRPALAPKALRTPAKPKALSGGGDTWTAGIAIGTAGARRYRLYTPPGVRRRERLPLVVMLHGCQQDAAALAASSRMNRIAARERFVVLYPEQDRLANPQGCWNWYDTRSGRAQGEADIIDAAIDRVCLSQPVDPRRIALVGLSAGAGLAALLATRHPERFCAVAMHSGIGPGVAHSSASALRAMLGHGRSAASPVAASQALVVAATPLPALLVIQGSADHIVAPCNGSEAAGRWAARAGAKAGRPRHLQRGARYPQTITDYRVRGRVVATLCIVDGLGHAWSGGAAGLAYSDPKGPDAARMIWTFIAKQFAASAATAAATAAAVAA